MQKKKSQKRTLNYIGVKQYNFNFQEEKNVYCYLFGLKHKRDVKKVLEEGKKDFERYSQWKQYVCDKYMNYSLENLEEFGKYLDIILFQNKPTQEYWNIVLPVLMSLIATNFFEGILAAQKLEIRGVSLALGVLILLFLMTIITVGFTFLVHKLLEIIWGNNSDEKFLIDYKEIIDDLIKEKRKAEKKRKKKEKKSNH